MDDSNKSTTIISKVEQYFYDDDVALQITEWGRNHCHAFGIKNPENVEQPVENMNLYKEYCTLIEEILTKYVFEIGYDSADLKDAIADEFDVVKRKDMAFASILLSYTDYFAFYELMHDIYNGGEAIFCPGLIDIRDGDEDTDIMEEDSDWVPNDDGKDCENKSLGDDAKGCNVAAYASDSKDSSHK